MDLASLVWRLTERRLRRVLPPARVASVLGDLAEDFARRRTTAGVVRAHVWLIGEARSLRAAYRAAAMQHAVAHTSGSRLMLADDIRHAWKRLTARPARPLLCAALLALGIGLATAMFSVVDSLLLRPAPFPHADRLVRHTLFRPEPDVMDAWRSGGMFEAVEAVRLRVFELRAEGAGTFRGAFVTPGVFDLLGVRALRGRLLEPSDARPGSDDVIVLSETIWRTAFGADPHLLGRRVRFAEESLVVIGIVSADVRFPTPVTVAWRPLDPATPSEEPTTIYGRLTAGTSLEAARPRAAVIMKALAYVPPNWGDGPKLSSIVEQDDDAFRRGGLWLLFAGVGLVYIALCGNVCSLLLSQVSARQREFATCAALGASRARIVRQAILEHTAIALAGAAGGIGLAAGLTTMIPDLFLERTLNVIDVDLRAQIVAAVLGAASVSIAGLVPAWLGTRSSPADSLRGSRQGGGDVPAARRLARGLLAAQIALACSLLVGSAILLRSFVHLANADRGLALDGLVLINVGGLDEAFARGPAMALGTAAIAAQVRTWPEVSAVALSREVPPTWDDALVRIDPSIPWESALRADSYRVGDDFFDLYGIRIVRGRRFAPNDAPGSTIVSERLAALLWPGQDPLQQAFDVGRTPSRVIGVAREITLPTLDAETDRPEFYVPLGSDSRTLYLNLRCRGDCPPGHVAQERLASVHPAIVARVTPPVERAFLSELQLPRAVAEIGGVFAIVAVLTAAGGLFSVMTAVVGRRRREFGIRTALGASPSQMRRLVFADALRLVALGVITGSAGGWIVARSLSSFHYGVTATDPVSWVAVLGTIAVASIGAAWRPALDAMRIDPVRLLREE